MTLTCIGKFKRISIPKILQKRQLKSCLSNNRLNIFIQSGAYVPELELELELELPSSPVASAPIAVTGAMV